MEPVPPTEQHEKKSGCHAVSAHFLVGCVLCPVVSATILPLVFGLDRRDPSATWLFVGVLDIIMGIIMTPVFMVVYGIVLRLLPGHLGVGARARWALLIALGIFMLAVGGGWLVLLGGRPVVRAW